MTEIYNKQEMDRAIEDNQFALFYLSRPSCGVCKSLKPKIEAIADQYSTLKQFYVNLENDESIIGQYSIFTIPGILVFVDGKESIREARYFSVGEIDSRLQRISEMLN